MAENNNENMFNDDERQYLQMMQGNIERMAVNSANCKTWMVTIVAAMMALQCSIQQLNGWILLGIAPIVLFWYLDTYYLHLERGMRNREKDFLNKMDDRSAEGYKKALFNFAPLMIKSKKLTEEDKQNGMVATDDRWFSESILPFYGVTLLIVVFVTIVLNWCGIIEYINCCKQL